MREWHQLQNIYQVLGDRFNCFSELHIDKKLIMKNREKRILSRKCLTDEQ